MYLTLVFTFTYAIRAIELLVTGIVYTNTEAAFFTDVYNQNLFRMTTKLLWDLPAIISTVWLNLGLVKELEAKNKERVTMLEVNPTLYESSNELDVSLDYENVRFTSFKNDSGTTL